MFIRTLASTAVATTLLAALAITGCKSNDSRTTTSNDTAYTSTTARTTVAHAQSCPVCGMHPDTRFTVNQDGKTAACCSQACCDKFNKSSSADKHAMMNHAWSTPPAAMNNAANTQEYASMENSYCPMSGQKVDGKHSVVVDGHRTDFCSEQCADEYRAMSPEHRAEVRAKAK